MIKQNFTGKKLGAKGLKDFVAYFGIPESHMRIMESFDLSSDHSLIIVTYSTVAHILTKPYKVISANTDINAFKSYLETDKIDHAVELLTEQDKVSYICTKLPARNSQSNQLYLSAEIRQQIQHKRNLRKRWQETLYPADKRSYNKAASDLRKLLSTLRN